jgi:transposase
MLTIGIDMSKATFHAALDDHAVKKFKNTPEGIDAFLEAITQHGHSPGDSTIGVEATGVYHLLFCTKLMQSGYRVMLINPLESHRFIKAMSLRRVKTDRADAQAIRQMIAAGIGRLFVETDEVLALKALVTEREGLVDILITMKLHREARSVRKRAISRPLYDPSPVLMEVVEKEIAMIETQFLAYAPATQCLLQTIPGIGPISAASLVAYIGDIRRFSSPEKLVAYIGLDCRVHESGTSVKGRGSISKRGNHRLRSILFNAAFGARQANPDLKEYFEKKTGEGKHYLSALVAVERKLVHLIYAVWTRGTPYVPKILLPRVRAMTR